MIELLSDVAVRTAIQTRWAHEASLVCMAVAGECFGFSPALFADRRRSHDEAMRRRVVFYLEHVVMGVSQTRIAREYGFSCNAVRYGLARIEDMRDDPDFDDRLMRAEHKVIEYMMTFIKMEECGQA